MDSGGYGYRGGRKGKVRVMFIINDLGINEPFGPMILSAIMKQKGHDTALGVLQKEDVEKKIVSWRPDVLAYSMMSVDMADMKRFNDSLRQKVQIFTILGGPHCTLDRSCVNDPGIDAICVGEGDDAIVDVVEHLEGGKSLKGIPNILTSADEPLIIRDLINDLDRLPFMDRELVYFYPEMARFGIKGIWTSRGCSFPCPYCFNNRYNETYRGKGKVVRRRTVESVINETKGLINNYRVDFIRIQDDVFVHRADEWLKEFAERWSSEIGVPFYCLLRAELITDEMAYYLKKAGCYSVCFSIEAANDRIRNKMLRRNMSTENMEDAFRILKRHKLNIYVNTMIALPFSSIEDDIASLDFNIKVKPDMPNFSIFMPYPGTDLGDYCEDAGIYDPDAEPVSYGMRNMSSLSCFSEREKRAQHNLCQLAIVAVKLPFLRNIIVKRLIFWRPNFLFFLIHYIFAVTAYGRKIFYYRHTPKEYIELVSKTARHFFNDFLMKKKGKSHPMDIRGHRDQRVESSGRLAELEKCIAAMTGGNCYDMRKRRE